MLKTFTAALLATSLIASPVFAAPPSGNAGSTPATAPAAAGQTAAKPAVAAKPTKMVKHLRKHRKHHGRHFVRGKGAMKVARHLKRGKTHRAHVARPAAVSHVKKSGKAAS